MRNLPARAAFDKLKLKLDRITPERFLTLNDEQLKIVGFSRQKAGYCRELAGAIIARRFRPRALERMSDDEARNALIDIKGIGSWSADIYLLMVLLRSDVWPTGDLALAVAARTDLNTFGEDGAEWQQLARDTLQDCR